MPTTQIFFSPYQSHLPIRGDVKIKMDHMLRWAHMWEGPTHPIALLLFGRIWMYGDYDYDWGGCYVKKNSSLNLRT
jgi:hypothetical protein